MPVPTQVKVEKEWLNQEVSFTAENGAVNKISYEGETIERDKKKTVNLGQELQQPTQEEQRQDVEEKPTGSFPRSTKKHARAPYNFVPLPEKVALKGQPNSSFDKYHEKQLTGRIDLEITNLTPLFIRQISEDENSFAIDEKYGIPGSSLRGMIRMLAEILSHSKFGPVGEQNLYYRAIYHRDPQKEDYKRQIGSNVVEKNGEKYSVPRSQAGYLKDGMITPAQKQKGRTYNRSKVRKLNSFSIRPGTSKQEWVVATGTSTKKNTEYCIHPPDKKEKLKVPKHVLRDFRNDENRAEEVDEYLKKCKKKCPHGIPVFYNVRDREIIHFGHTPFYRIPYQNSIQDQVTAQLRKTESGYKDPDIIENLFGEQFKKKMIASRLSFGDLLASNAQAFSQAQLLKILASPKPTTFQHYVEQDDPNRVKNWNADANLRGYKLYWHRGTNDSGAVDISWKEPEGTEQTKSHSARVKPLQPNATFSGSIWFQNLSNVELGLLLEALEPSVEYENENTYPAHKIGLAKPLGLGSIKIKVDGLSILDTEEMYRKKKAAFIDNGHCQPQSTEKDPNVYKQEFQRELLEKLNTSEDSIWDLQRLKELKTMLEFNAKAIEEKDWLQKTRYMEIEREGNPKKEKNEFGQRPILPKASEVKSSRSNKFI